MRGACEARLTVVRHPALGILLPCEDVVVVPLPIAILAVALCGEVGNEVRGRSLHDVEEGEEKPCNGTDRAELDKAVSKGAVFVDAALLVMFRVVRESGKDLWGKSGRSVRAAAGGGTPSHGLPAPSFRGACHPWGCGKRTCRTNGGSGSCPRAQPSWSRRGAWPRREARRRHAVCLKTSAGTRWRIGRALPLCTCLRGRGGERGRRGKSSVWPDTRQVRKRAHLMSCQSP